MSRAMSVTQLINKKRKLLPFEGQWLDAIGRPERKGSWIVWAQSTSGKTTFVMMLSKYLARFGQVAYNSLEEGDSETIKMALLRVEMKSVRSRFVLLDKEPINELKERLRKHKAPKFIILDSIQYSMMSYAEYVELLREFPNTLFIIVSHADGNEPYGRVAKAIRYDANVKIRVEGYKAFVQSRYMTEQSKPIVIWDKGAERYWGFHDGEANNEITNHIHEARAAK